jgi:hypothetical protein
VSKKMSWAVDKTSLVLRLADGVKETTWKLRKTAKAEDLARVFGEIFDSLMDIKPYTAAEEFYEPVAPSWVPEVVDTGEEASRAAQAARVRQLNEGAKWWDADEEEGYGIPIPDYDSGEIQ